MNFPIFSRGKLASIERLLNALIDEKRRDRTVLLVLGSYVVVWTLYGVLAKGSQDIHFDMGEMVAWSREPALGTPKHPPLAAWLVGFWFKIFPLADWAYYLLAMIVSATGLWIAWLLSGKYLEGEKRVTGLALLTLIPFFNFHALKFNANTALIPLWGATTLWFFRSFETRSLFYAALAGLAAAAAMLGKYWSIVLLAGLAFAALTNPRRGLYFRSAAPWITVAVGALAISPHIIWLIVHHFSPFDYALDSHASETIAETLTGVLGFLGGTLGYIAIPAGIATAIARPERTALLDTIWPATPERWLAVVAFAAPLLIAAIAAFAAQAQIVSLWAMPAMSLLPVVLLSSPLVSVPRIAAVRLLAVAIALPILAVLVAPIIAMIIHRNGVPHHAAHYQRLADSIERHWYDTTRHPLRLVGSSTDLVNGVVFYLSDKPSTLDVFAPEQTPWASTGRIAEEGVALVCPADEEPCIQAIATIAANSPARRTEVEIARSYLGVLDKPERYVIVVRPPRQ